LFILLACRLNIIVQQPQHHNYLNIISSSNNHSLTEYWNSYFAEFMLCALIFLIMINSTHTTNTLR